MPKRTVRLAPTPLTLTELKTGMGLVFREAEFGQRFIILSHGREIAGIVSVDDMEKLEAVK